MSRYDIITTVYNDEDNIIELLKELEAQTLWPDKVIITDGGSKDETVNVIKSFADKSKLPIIIYEGERLNIAQGFNKGIQNSKSEYIGIVACGNHYPDNYFECLAKTLDNENMAQVAFAPVRGDRKTEFCEAYEHVFMNFYRAFPSNHGNLARRNLYKQYGCFCEELSYAGEDTEYFGRIIGMGGKVCLNEETYCIWEVPDNLQKYIKQTKNYIIGNMELFDNRTLLKFYKKKMVYCLLYLTPLMSLLLPKSISKIVAGIELFILIGFNIRLYTIKGKHYYLIKQIDYVYWCVVFLKNMKLFSKKNKISHPLNIDVGRI